MKYTLQTRCDKFVDGNDVQSIVHWDEDAKNKYFIDDEYLKNGTISIITPDQFKQIVGDEFIPQNTEYFAYNKDLNLYWAYDSNDYHWFYAPYDMSSKWELE